MLKRFDITIMFLQIMFVIPFMMGLLFSILNGSLEVFIIYFMAWMVGLGFITASIALIEIMFFTIEQVKIQKNHH